MLERRRFQPTFQRTLLSEGFDDDDDREDLDDEQPTVVVLKDGDLTAEQVKAEMEKDSGELLLLCAPVLKRSSSYEKELTSRSELRAMSFILNNKP